MIAEGAAWADLFLSVAALLGLWALHHSISARGRRAPLNRRFLVGIRLTMLLFAGRSLVFLTGWAVFETMEYVAAAGIPLAVLVLTEGLLRRHAPMAVKLFVAGGTVLFGGGGGGSRPSRRSCPARRSTACWRSRSSACCSAAGWCSRATGPRSRRRRTARWSGWASR